MKGYARFFLMSLLSYRYGSAAATSLALKDVMQGPTFFTSNLDMRSRFGLINEMRKLDEGSNLPHAPAGTEVFNISRESVARKILRIMTINGFILPPFLCHNPAVFQEPGFGAKLKQTFRYSSIYYGQSPDSSGELVTIDRWKALKLTPGFLSNMLLLALRFSEIRRSYEDQFPKISSRKFWEQVYPLEQESRISERAESGA